MYSYGTYCVISSHVHFAPYLEYYDNVMYAIKLKVEKKNGREKRLLKDILISSLNCNTF